MTMTAVDWRSFSLFVNSQWLFVERWVCAICYSSCTVCPLRLFTHTVSFNISAQTFLADGIDSLWGFLLSGACCLITGVISTMVRYLRFEQLQYQSLGLANGRFHFSHLPSRINDYEICPRRRGNNGYIPCGKSRMWKLSESQLVVHLLKLHPFLPSLTFVSIVIHDTGPNCSVWICRRSNMDWCYCRQACCSAWVSWRDAAHSKQHYGTHYSCLGQFHGWPIRKRYHGSKRASEHGHHRMLCWTIVQHSYWSGCWFWFVEEHQENRDHLR